MAKNFVRPLIFKIQNCKAKLSIFDMDTLAFYPGMKTKLQTSFILLVVAIVDYYFLKGYLNEKSYCKH